jgi:hypothetical protein
MQEFLETFDGLASNTIFCFWTGSNVMSPQRINALWTIFNHTHCPVAFINHDSYKNWQVKGSAFHPAFPYLSETHKSDYLRCYFMHHFGGGYTDIKLTHKSWPPLFKLLRDSSALVLGYQEVPNGVPHVTGPLGDEIRLHHKEIIGMGAFIFRKKSPLTSKWFELTHSVLDKKLEELKLNPAKHPQDQYGVLFDNKYPSPYPLRWAELLGEVFHPLIYQYKKELIQADIAPIFHSYR